MFIKLNCNLAAFLFAITLICPYCFDMGFLENAILCEDETHLEHVRHVFRSSFLQSTFNRKYSRLCKICDGADPYWMLIAHEMIHMEHFLTQEVVKLCSQKFFGGECPDLSKVDSSFANSKKASIQTTLKELFEILKGSHYLEIEPIKAMYDCLIRYSHFNLQKMFDEFYKKIRYTESQSVTQQEVAKLVVPSGKALPELEDRHFSHSYLWKDFEERETVIGAKGSELELRFAARLPIRYIYQDKGKQFYESFDTVFQIVKNVRSSLKRGELIVFINSYESAKYFDTRKFRHIIDEELLRDSLFEQLGFKRDVKIIETDISPPQLPKRKMPSKLAARLLDRKIPED